MSLPLLGCFFMFHPFCVGFILTPLFVVFFFSSFLPNLLVLISSYICTELDQLNSGSNSHTISSNNSDEDATTTLAASRNKALRQALELQIELQQTRRQKQRLVRHGGFGRPLPEEQSDKVPPTSSVDHSFDHFVDYRSMGEFESH